MKKTTSFYTALLTVGMLAVAGCSWKPGNVGHQMVAEPDGVSLRLAASVDRASTALQTLAAVEQSRTPLASVSPVKDAPRELLRTVSVEWVGPIEPITQRLAERVGYKFNIIGLQPPVPVIVTLNTAEKPVIDVLRDIGLQSGQRADIIVDAELKTVEVSYRTLYGEPF
ncbi:MAG: hypothetical protein EA357_12035 [Micavibrio sp.]|jgi:defect-in-organelle-trafficking protein DotD|nr:MAG: hypothetical protein EA357_12035 [Micavibrio sp.]